MTLPSRLAIEQIDTLQAYIDFVINQLDRVDLEIDLFPGVSPVIGYLKGEPDSHGAPQTHDPNLCYVTEGNSFCLVVRERRPRPHIKGKIVVTHMHKLTVTDDFIGDCIRQVYFMDKVPKFSLTPCVFSAEAQAVAIDGRVALGAGNFIHPEWRKSVQNRIDLMIVNRMSRALALIHWNFSYVVGTVLGTRTKFALEGAKYRNAIPLLSGGMPGKESKAENILLCWSSRDEFLEDIAQELRGEGIQA